MAKKQFSISDSYITIQGWMSSELQLKGNRLMIFALVYGFSSDGVSCFKGSNEYAATWINGSSRTVINVFNDLIREGLIVSSETYENGKTINERRANLPEIARRRKHQGGEKLSPRGVKDFHQGGEKLSPRGVKNFHQGGEKLSPNIIANKDNDNNIGGKDKNQPAPPPISISENKILNQLPYVTLEHLQAVYTSAGKNPPTTKSLVIEHAKEWGKWAEEKRPELLRQSEWRQWQHFKDNWIIYIKNTKSKNYGTSTNNGHNFDNIAREARKILDDPFSFIPD